MATNAKEKNDIFKVIDINNPFSTQSTTKRRGSIRDIPATKGKTIDSALEAIVQQMRISGHRERTIDDYTRYTRQFQSVTKIEYVEDITTESIYQWLDSMEVSNSTKLTRLKSFKAVLSRCYDNGWLKVKFWNTINIKVDKHIKKAPSVNDIEVLLSLLDLNTFIGLRDCVAILTLYRTGIRINTLGQLQYHHVDFENKELVMDGDIMKNHKALKLPLDDQLLQLIDILMQQNHKIREYYREDNSNLFISRLGTPLNTKSHTNAISKQLHKYSTRYDLKNINPHALRRGYATNLLKAGADITLISKALGHSDLKVTTQYLDIGIDEVSNSLREFL